MEYNCKHREQFPKNLAIKDKIWYCYLVRIRFGRAENFFIIFLKMIVKKLTAFCIMKNMDKETRKWQKK